MKTSADSRALSKGISAPPTLLGDARVRSVAWRDLATLTPLESARELALALPWLLASLALAWVGLYPLALGLSFVLFLAGLRLVHDAFHHNLGLSRRATELVIFAVGVVMLGSMHAVQWNHMRHHRHCLDDEDVEARSARMSGPRAILWGPVFPVLLHAAALRSAGRRVRRWIVAELAATALVIGVAASPLGGPVLRYHVAAMVVGQCLTAFFAVWTVHHDCDRDGEIARTLRNRLKSTIALDMFFHLEHHLFPRVPTRHLPELARRLDRTAPGVAGKQVY